ncbi:MAG: 5'-nucleotidase, lipoprotein e(P4) family [Ignavibacteriales bacterium]|nr:5'-nucleotidase, lipoprotein e(P4) family [Ignavibacteriales bacterium]
MKTPNKNRTTFLFVIGVLLLLPVTFFRLSQQQIANTRNEHLVMSVLWFQTSAEMRALSYQAFNIAKMRIDHDIATNKRKRKKAVLVDIDETILDNSPHMGKLIKDNQAFPFAWTEWVNRAQAEPLPGAVEFLNYAASRGYDVFYVSNRSASSETEGTLKNLKAKGLPQATDDHLLLMSVASSKESRRNTIEKTHDIVLLMGDNLNDLANVFEKKAVLDRFSEVDKVKEQFGNRFIVLPNPMYGEWEGALYGYQRGLSDSLKNEMRKAALKSF